MLEKVTPLIITFNEAPNLEFTLQQLSWAHSIVVVDSFSTDSTLEILTRYPQVQVYQRKFDTFAGQCNFGLEQIESEWVLSIDADYIVTPDLVKEIDAIEDRPQLDGFTVRFKYCVLGRPLRATLYPPRTVLYRRAKAKYEDDGHAHHVNIAGSTALLNSYILHDDRKSLSRWTSSQGKYVLRELQKLRQMPAECLGATDRIRKLKIVAPFLVMFYCLFLHRVCLDGWHGLFYAYQRSIAETMLALEIIRADVSGDIDDLSAEISRQNDNAERISIRLTTGPDLSLVERIRKTKLVAPLLVPLYFLIARMGILIGWNGWAIAFQKMLSEMLLAVYLIQLENLREKLPLSGAKSPRWTNARDAVS